MLEYNFYTEDMFKTWTLIDIPERYDATKTDQYFIFKNSKYYIWEVNFVESIDMKMKPIIAEFGASAPQFPPGTINADFINKGKQRLPFLYAVKEGNQN